MNSRKKKDENIRKDQKWDKRQKDEERAWLIRQKIKSRIFILAACHVNLASFVRPKTMLQKKKTCRDINNDCAAIQEGNIIKNV